MRGGLKDSFMSAFGSCTLHSGSGDSSESSRESSTAIGAGAKFDLVHYSDFTKRLIVHGRSHYNNSNLWSEIGITKDILAFPAKTDFPIVGTDGGSTTSAGQGRGSSIGHTHDGGESGNNKKNNNNSGNNISVEIWRNEEDTGDRAFTWAPSSLPPPAEKILSESELSSIDNPKRIEFPEHGVNIDGGGGIGSCRTSTRISSGVSSDVPLASAKNNQEVMAVNRSSPLLNATKREVTVAELAANGLHKKQQPSKFRVIRSKPPAAERSDKDLPLLLPELGSWFGPVDRRPLRNVVGRGARPSSLPAAISTTKLDNLSKRRLTAPVQKRMKLPVFTQPSAASDAGVSVLSTASPPSPASAGTPTSAPPFPSSSTLAPTIYKAPTARSKAPGTSMSTGTTGRQQQQSAKRLIPPRPHPAVVPGVRVVREQVELKASAKAEPAFNLNVALLESATKQNNKGKAPFSRQPAPEARTPLNMQASSWNRNPSNKQAVSNIQNLSSKQAVRNKKPASKPSVPKVRAREEYKEVQKCPALPLKPPPMPQLARRVGQDISNRNTFFSSTSRGKIDCQMTRSTCGVGKEGIGNGIGDDGHSFQSGTNVLDGFKTTRGPPKETGYKRERGSGVEGRLGRIKADPCALLDIRAQRGRELYEELITNPGDRRPKMSPVRINRWDRRRAHDLLW